jgi:AbrB family looped-hinge helix DNA binding protein
MQTSIDKFGRILVPKELRDGMGLAPGAPVELERSGDSLVITPRTQSPLLVREGNVLVFTGEFLGQAPGICEMIDQGRADRDRQVSGLDEDENPL